MKEMDGVVLAPQSARVEPDERHQTRPIRGVHEPVPTGDPPVLVGPDVVPLAQFQHRAVGECPRVGVAGREAPIARNTRERADEPVVGHVLPPHAPLGREDVSVRRVLLDGFRDLVGEHVGGRLWDTVVEQRTHHHRVRRPDELVAEGDTTTALDGLGVALPFFEGDFLV